VAPPGERARKRERERRATSETGKEESEK